MQSIKEKTSPASIASSPDPISGSMLKMTRLVGVEKARMHSW